MTLRLSAPRATRLSASGQDVRVFGKDCSFNAVHARALTRIRLEAGIEHVDVRAPLPFRPLPLVGKSDTWQHGIGYADTHSNSARFIGQNDFVAVPQMAIGRVPWMHGDGCAWI